VGILCQPNTATIRSRATGRATETLHIEPDWLVIYRIVNDELRLARTGTHADIFNE
jgi:mRNA interferase YafQ